MTSEAPVKPAETPARPALDVAAMNLEAVKSIYRFEMARFFRTWMQSVLSPVISTSLYFVVFGAAIGSQIREIENVSYGAFIVPGLIMMMILTQSVANGSFGIFFPKFLGTIYELLSAPVSAMEIVLGYVGAAASKSLVLGVVVLLTAGFFVAIRIDHPLWMLFFLVSTAVAFSLLGFIIGIVVKGMDQLQVVPLLIIMPLTFLGGVFYPLNVLPPFWQTVSLFNPIVYLISGFRWSFYSVADVDMSISIVMTLVLLVVELGIVAWIFRTGYRIKN
jgi:ABC-2 type transport system permease protein